jgi:hypothetical protein
VSVGLGEVIVRGLALAPLVTEFEVDRPYARFVYFILKYVPRPASGDINSYGIRDYE